MVSRSFVAQVPVPLEVPSSMVESVAEVLNGEYEAGYSGRGLTVLDIGANVGAFSVWADMRWPGSHIVAFEPHPLTFAMLERNVAGRRNIECRQLAVSSVAGERATFWSRHAGDGESGLQRYVAETFEATTQAQTFEVDVVHPARLASADIVKIDVEGAEADILLGLDLTGTSLVLLEYQNDRNRAAIKEFMRDRFHVVMEDAHLWDGLLGRSQTYRRSLAGDHWGHMGFLSKDTSLERVTADVAREDRPSRTRRILQGVKSVLK